MTFKKRKLGRTRSTFVNAFPVLPVRGIQYADSTSSILMISIDLLRDGKHRGVLVPRLMRRAGPVRELDPEAAMAAEATETTTKSVLTTVSIAGVSRTLRWWLTDSRCGRNFGDGIIWTLGGRIQVWNRKKRYICRERWGANRCPSDTPARF